MSHTGAPKHAKQVVTERETGGNTILGYFNAPLISMDGASRQKISKATEILNGTTEQLDLLDIFRKLHPKEKKKPTRTHILIKYILNILYSTKQASTNLRI